MLEVLSPSEQILKILIPSLKPMATLKVNGWVSIEEGWSVGLKDVYQASIRSKEVEPTC